MRSDLRGLTASLMTTAPGKRVLVVDDDADLVGLLMAVLQQNGLTVDTALDGSEALDRLAENHYSVVLLDLMMPVLDGFGVIEALERLSTNTMPVVLVMTGAPELIEQLDPRAIHGIVRKPFDVGEVASLVLSCADIRQRGLFETMAIAAVLAGTPLMALLTRM